MRPSAIPSPRSANRQHLGADLVAAGADPGPDRGGGGFDQRRTAGDDPGRQPAPAAVEHRHAARPGERHRQAVGGEDERREAGTADDVPVELLQPCARFGEGARLLRRVVDGDSALWTCSPIGTSRGDPDRAGEPPPVLDHGGVASSVSTPMFSDSYGASQTPPTRVPNPTRPTPAPAGQLGREPPHPVSL